MPFKRAGWLQPLQLFSQRLKLAVSMPFKRAGWLQLLHALTKRGRQSFQCPLSGLVGCNLVPGEWQLTHVSFNAL